MRWLGAIAIILAGFCVVYTNWEMILGSGRPSIQGVDDTGYYVWVRSAIIDGDFDFTNDVAEAPMLRSPIREEWLDFPRTPNGLLPNKYPPGWAVATLPAFLVGHAVALLTGVEADGWSPPYFVAMWLWHLGLAVAGVWCAWRVVARFVRKDIAAMAVGALWIASPLAYYHAGRVGMTHGLIFTLLAAIYHQSLCIRDGHSQLWRWALIGFLGGLVVLVRMPTALYLLFPALVLARDFWQGGWRERLLHLGATLVPLALMASLIFAANYALHGSWWVTPYPGEPFQLLRPRFRDVLFSPLHGLFYWHPLLMIGVAGLVCAMWRRDLPRSWGVTALGIVYVNAAWHNWWFGSSFGSRSFDGVVLFAMVGLGWLLARMLPVPVWRRVALSIVGFTIVAGAVLLVLFVVQAIPREQPVTYWDMLAAIGPALEKLFGGTGG